MSTPAGVKVASVYVCIGRRWDHGPNQCQGHVHECRQWKTRLICKVVFPKSKYMFSIDCPDTDYYHTN